MQGNERTQYETQYAKLLTTVQNDIQDANYNGKTLIGNITGSSGAFGEVSVVRNENAATYGIATFGGSELYRFDRLYDDADERCVHGCGADQRHWHVPQPDERGRRRVERHWLLGPTT